MPPKTNNNDEKDERKLHGVWRNIVAVFNPRNNKWEKRLIQFKMLITIMMTAGKGLVVPLGFMYKHRHGCFIPVGELAAAELKKTKWPTFSSLKPGEDPVPREKGLFLGNVSSPTPCPQVPKLSERS